MQSEHLTNVHPGWVLGGWLVAIATTSAVFLGEVGMGLVGPDGGGTAAFVVAVALGFFVGGLFVGARWSEAPILHAMALALVSLVVLLAVDLLGVGADLEASRSVPLALGTVLVQVLAGATGGIMGRRVLGGGGR